ncbi:MAG: methyltransferase domain-containing protein [Deltaproteobacteria bacterium]|nr:methyltransferase domain-containing protein [Deltaproteobacteria bacterium]
MTKLPVALPFQQSDAGHRGFQFLEDLATAHWYSEVLFTALDLNLFGCIEAGNQDLDRLACAASCRKESLDRLLRVLERLELVCRTNEGWSNNPIARLYLIPGSESYMGDFFLYRRYIRPKWSGLTQAVSPDRNASARIEAQQGEDYECRTERYVRALDALARVKAPEIVSLIQSQTWESPILDVAGGAGALSRALIKTRPGSRAVLFELPEVLSAAKMLYPDPADWESIETSEGDFRTHRFDREQVFGLVLLSNFLHAYGPEEARLLLHKALGLLAPDGLLVIHDYFPDRFGHSPHKGVLYDLNMMLNTYNGACHDTAHVGEWISEAGMTHVATRDLPSDTSVILASRRPLENTDRPEMEGLLHAARSSGFSRAVLMPADQVVVAPWVRLKCRFGCSGYSNNRQCPPFAMPEEATRRLLDTYATVMVIEGAPPGLEFHENLLRVEKEAFLAGFHKALVFGAGPCPLCSPCPVEGPCRHPKRARPSMEACGMDVYATARNAGIRIEPLTEPLQYVKYIGLLLLE